MPRVQTTILLLLLYLLIIGPVNFYLVRRYDRPMWLIVTTPTIALLSIGVLAIWNLRVKGLTPTARQFSVLIPSTEPGGAVRSTYLGVYSPSAQVYKLELDARASANLFGINAVQPMVRKLRRGASVGPTSLFVDNYGMGYIHLLQPVEHHNPIILRRKRFDPTVELTNGVDLALTKPLLLRIIDRPASARYRRVKRLIAQPIDVDLPRGATIRTTLSKSDRQFDPALLRAHWGADHLHEARFAYRLTSAILSHARSTGPWIVALAHNDIRPELDTQRTIKPGVTTTRQWRLVIGPIKLVQQ